MSTTTPPEPDTAAIRAEYSAPQWVWKVVDALDAAYADVDMARDCEWAAQVRAEAAEARITAALDIIDKSGACTVWKIRAALTEGQTDG